MRQPRPADTEKGELRRQQLLAAAAECFRREGFHGTSIARIREAAGMSAGHIYHYFVSKEAIVQAIAERDENDMAALLNALESDTRGGDLLTRLDRHVRALVKHVTATPRTSLMLELAAEGARNPDVRKLLQQGDQRTARRLFTLFRRENVASKLNDEELRLRIEMIATIVNGLAGRSSMNPGQDRNAMAALVSRSMRMLLDDTGR
ncbi:TetR/AcrR family transcriptional regulator [Rhodanobacter lindaniclasticus]